MKSITTWGGVAITVSGIVLSVATGGNLMSGGLSLLGVLLTCCGHWTSAAIGKHEAAERVQDKQSLEELEDRLEQTEKDADSASEYRNKQMAAMERQLRDWSLRFDDPGALD